MASPSPNSPARVPLLQGRTVESILDVLREAEHWHHQVSKVVLDREDERRVELAAIRVEEIQKILAWLPTQPGDRYSDEDIPHRRLIRRTVLTLSLSGRTVKVSQISIPRMAGHFGAAAMTCSPAPVSTWAASMVSLTCSVKVAVPLRLVPAATRQRMWSGDLLDRAGQRDLDRAGQIRRDTHPRFTASSGRSHHRSPNKSGTAATPRPAPASR